MKFPMPNITGVVDFAKKNVQTIAIVAVVGLLVWYLATRKTVQGFVSGASSADGTFTLVYADWCPHCKAIAPQVKAAEGPMQIGGKTFLIQAVESKEEDRIKSLGTEVKGFPTMLFKGSDGAVEEVQVDRTMDAIKQFLAGK